MSGYVVFFILIPISDNLVISAVFGMDGLVEWFELLGELGVVGLGVVAGVHV